MTTHDPVVTDDDLDELLERQQEQGLACSGCGLPRDEVWPEDSDSSRELDGVFYSEPMKCKACEARDRAKQRYESNEHKDTAGIFFPIYRRE